MLVKPCPRCAAIGTLEATDLFCGAGGSSLGLENVRCPDCGRQLIRVVQALNHWDLAVEAHNANFPHADHDLHDVEIVPVTRFRRTDMLWASPECVHHAYCRGKKSDDESAERSRMTMWDVVRFTKHHRYDAVIVENVIEARLWDPFDDWFAQIEALGYEGQIVFFNSQFALPTPQSRDRMYVVFWRKGVPVPRLNFAPASWCSHCEKVVQGVQTWKPASKGSVRDRIFEWGRYGAQYVYTCPECFATVAPAVTGAKTIVDWSIPMETIGSRKRPIAVKTRTRIRNGVHRLSTIEPIVVQVGGHLYERPGYARVWSVDDPLRAVTGTSCMSLVVPQPDGVIVRAGGQEGGKGSPTGGPMQTITAHDRQLALVIPNNQHNVGGDVSEPVGAVTTGNRHMLVQVSRGSKSANEDRSRSIDVPTRTIAGHGELALVSFRNHGDTSPIDAPAHTVTAGGHHHGLLVYNGVPGFVRSLEDAAGTVTGRDKQALVVPPTTPEPIVLSEEDIDNCLFRMLQWPELLAAQQMHLRPDGSAYELTAMRRNKRGQMVGLSNELRVKMIGNAVSSPVATLLGYAVASSLAGWNEAEAA